MKITEFLVHRVDLLTAYAELNTAIQAFNEAGVYKFMLKPWNDVDLKMTIRRALEARHLSMERDVLLKQVKAQEAKLLELEREHPGITQLELDDSGRIILEDES